MKKRELLKQLHNLKNFKPDLEWQRTNREILLSQIKAQTKAEFVFSNKLLFKNLFVAAYKPIGGLILIIGILFGAWIASVGATRNSLPGDLLYGFKLTTERMQVNLTLNDEKRTNLEMAFAERRLDEIKKTVAKDGSSSGKKNLELTFKKYQESINNVKSNLAKLEITNKQTAIKVANLVDEKTKVYVNILKDQQEQNPQLTNKDTEQAISVSKATGDKALAVILNEFEVGGSGLKIDDLRQKIGNRIEDIEKNIESAKTDIEKIIANKKIAEEAAASAAAKALAEKKAADEKAAAEAKAAETEKPASLEQSKTTETPSTGSEADKAQTAETKTDTLATETVKPAEENTTAEVNTEEKEPEEVLPTIEEIKDKPKEAQALLAKAQDYLKSGSVSQAFDLVKQADDIMTLVEKVIKANEQYLDTQINNDETSSTDSTIGKQEEVNG